MCVYPFMCSLFIYLTFASLLLMFLRAVDFHNIRKRTVQIIGTIETTCKTKHFDWQIRTNMEDADDDVTPVSSTAVTSWVIAVRSTDTEWSNESHLNQWTSFNHCGLIKRWHPSDTYTCQRDKQCQEGFGSWCMRGLCVHQYSHLQGLQKVFTTLDFFHILLCYSLNLKCIKLRCLVTDLHTIPHNVKMELCFKKCLQISWNVNKYSSLLLCQA
jgi:hypothetical protein